MIDREKVIRGLEECLSASCRGFKPGVYCPVTVETWNYIRDALALLKAQEPVEPKIVGRETHWYECECGTGIDYEDPYCRGCGRPVKWG